MSDDAGNLEALIDRIGETHFRQRFNIQIGHAAEMFGQGRTLFHVENMEWLMVFIYYVLRITGFYRRGLRNVKDIRITENTVNLPELPKAFAGYTILHLSDLHLDITKGLTEAIIERVKDLDYDLCVITGDYRASTSGSYSLAIEETIKLIPHLKVPVYAVLGNHDFIEFVPPLEDAGITFLLNETVALQRDEAIIYLSGVDDPHLYETDNLHKTGDPIPAGSLSLLLAHSPEIYRRAAASGYDFILCGHTHAGQICLPGRKAILNNANCPRSMVYGSWRHENLQGYTSAGTGSCGVPARFFCPPEVTLHRLTSRQSQ
jgi:predicted MPP superfamily phosphohydrolase